MKKRISALILAGIMILTLISCGTDKNISGEVSYDIPEGKQIPDDAVLNVTIASHPSWPYDENWEVWEYITESIGGTINVHAIPSSDFGTKFSLVMAAPDEFPDVFSFQATPNGFSSFCEQGAFLALDDYEEFLPDYNEFWNGLPEKDRWMRETRRAADGKVYYAPVYGMERYTNLSNWMYRKDIFEKHNLKVPETLDELYEVCKELKAIYPDSYPFCSRGGYDALYSIGSSFKPNFNMYTYYDFENEKWCYGATDSEIALEIVQFYKKMIDEGLMPPNYFNIDTSSWQELVSTNRGFIMCEYQVRIDFFQNIVRQKNPEFTLAVMVPPKSTNGSGISMVNKQNYDPTGFAVANTGDAGSIANAMRYVNWFYSNEAAELVSWGKEGETYEIIDGKKKFITDGQTTNTQILYGFKTIGSYLRVDPEVINESMSEEQAATTDFMIEYTYPHLDPSKYIELPSDAATKASDYHTMLKSFIEENLTKFALGQRPMSEWDEFQKDLSEMPVKELLEIYEKAYNEFK